MIKTTYTLILLIGAILFNCGICSAQGEYNIIDDTVRISSSTYAELKFMNEPEFQRMSEDYTVQQVDRSLTVKPTKGVTKIKARLKVTEGPRNKRREHYFVILYDKNANANDRDYDFSTIELIKERIKLIKEEKERAKQKQQLNVQKNDQPQPMSPDEESGKRTNMGGEAEQMLLGSIPEKRIMERIQLKIDLFNKNCAYLCNKQYPYNKMSLIKKMLETLFEDKENVIVQTFSPRTKQTASYKVREYLIRLTKFKYSNVVMKTSAIRFITKLKPIGEGEYEGTVVVVQDFEAYIDKSILAYKDKTQKAITVIVKIFKDVDDEGNEVVDFEIYLGDIKVDNTVD